MTADIPIILVHKADHWPSYMVVSMLQAIRTNGRNPIYVVTNADAAGVEHVRVLRYDDFEPSLRDLRSIYFHISQLSYEFERTCIERWFIIRDIMRREKLERVFCMDSDVLLFCSIPELAHRFADADFTYLLDISWAVVFINRRQVLEDYCDMTMRLYNRDADVWPRFANDIGFNIPYAKLPNISDMGLVGLFRQLYADKYRSCDAAQVIQGSLIDPNFNHPLPGLQMDGDRKKLEWIEGFPCGRLEGSGQLVRFDLLHCQGVYAKGLMRDLYDRFTPTYERLASGK